jgi:hypothetical protein
MDTSNIMLKHLYLHRSRADSFESILFRNMQIFQAIHPHLRLFYRPYGLPCGMEVEE